MILDKNNHSETQCFYVIFDAHSVYQMIGTKNLGAILHLKNQLSNTSIELVIYILL